MALSNFTTPAGRVGSGAQTGIYNAADRAQVEGQQKLAQDAFQRDMAAKQLGAGIYGDATRMKYGVMNDAYTSPGQMASLIIPAIAQLGGSAMEAGGDALKYSNPLVTLLANLSGGG